MNFIERVMRVMTHVSIGAAPGLAAWVGWSGWQLVTGQIEPAYRVAEAKALMSLPDAAPQKAMQLVTVGTGRHSSCHELVPATRGPAGAGEDL